MSQNHLVVPLVVMRPAELVLSQLPSSTPLILQPEPTNPYDSEAIQVLVDLNSLPLNSVEALKENLPSRGWTWNDLLASSPEFFLGYIAKPRPGTDFHGQPYQRPGNTQVLAFMANHPSHEATLTFEPSGRPLVRLANPIRRNQK